MSNMPLIVGFGGFNSAGRSSGHQAYQRMIFESLDQVSKEKLIAGLGALMGLDDPSEEEVLAGTLVRKMDGKLFDIEASEVSQPINLAANSDAPLTFELKAKQVPENVPPGWKVEPLDESGKRFLVTVSESLDVLTTVKTSMPVKAAGQLPSGFDPAEHYRSQHHPRGIQMNVLAASDALHSIGIEWQTIQDSVTPDEVCVYSSSVMSQLDQTAFGGLIKGRLAGKRVSSKQLAMGFTSMPADFTNAYVLGSLGATAGITGACATFLYNLRWAVEDIRSGRRKVAVVGCSEAPILPEVIDGYVAMSALASDADLRKLDNALEPDYRRASRPFSENCGFTLAESAQYVVLMSDELVLELGAEVYGAVPGVFVNADGHKKSISAPGAGNYITMAKAVGLARNLLGEDAVKKKSFIQAHGSSTPHNRTTESKIFDEVAKAFDIDNWPVVAVKSYLGHSLGPASGDQLACTLGVFAHNILPGIKTIDKVASDVHSDRLSIQAEDRQVDPEDIEVAFLNSKGFGGNNATATVLSPKAARRFLDNRYSKHELDAYEEKRKITQTKRDSYLAEADKGNFSAIYEFGCDLIDEEQIKIDESSVTIPGYSQAIALNDDFGFEAF